MIDLNKYYLVNLYISSNYKGFEVNTRRGKKVYAYDGDFIRAFSGVNGKKLTEGIVVTDNWLKSIRSDYIVANNAILPIKIIKKHAKEITYYYDEDNILIVSIYFKNKEIVLENCYPMYEYTLKNPSPNDEYYVKIKNNPFKIILKERGVRINDKNEQ